MYIDETFRPQLANLSEESFDLSADVTYIIDDRFCLRGYNEAWRTFALCNGGAALLDQYPFGRSILEAMSPEPRAFYAAAYRAALESQGRFDQRFECPSALVYRDLQQSAYPLANACGLVVTNHLVAEHPLESTGEHTPALYLSQDGLVTQCCHCRRVADQTIANKWDWVAQWVDSPPPATTHTFCPACYDFYYRGIVPPTARRSNAALPSSLVVLPGASIRPTLAGMPLDPIISPHELAALRDVVLFDCRPDAAAWQAGHLPGAIHAQLERDLSAPAPDPARGGRHPLPDVHVLAERLGSWGVTPASRVVAYDDQHGANAAARLWWLLKAVGHERVQVVDGGLAALLRAGFTLTAEAPEPPAQPRYPVATLGGARADMAEVEQARTAADRRVIDVRAAARYRGDSEPIDPVAGHIPGARNVPLSDNLHPDGTWKSCEELRALYDAALDGVAPAQTIVHCGSGVTACHSLLALERAGLRGAKLYVGSWSEWCRNAEREREPR